MPQKSDTALLVMDYQVGVGDQPYAQDALKQVEAALAAARKAGLSIAFTKIGFLNGYTDVSPDNKVFWMIKEKNLIPPGSSQVVPALAPSPGEIVLDKDRYSAFCGNALHELLRSNAIQHLVLVGLDTSGVVLATYVEAVDLDYRVTILSDGCADKDTDLQAQLMTGLFPHSADVLTTSEWIAKL